MRLSPWLGRRLVLALGIGASAAAFYAGTGLHPIWPYAWIAPLPLLVLAPLTGPWTAALVAFAAYLLGNLNMAGYLALVMPVRAVVLVLLLPAMVFAVVLLAVRRAILTLPPWLSVFVLPTAWTSYEWLLSLASPHGTAGSIAYSQSALLPIIQVVSLTGIAGITFLLMLVPAALATSWWTLYTRRPRAWTPLALTAGIMAVVLVFGLARLSSSPAASAIRVGLSASDDTVRFFDTIRPDEAGRVAAVYADRIRKLAGRGASIVVLPEKMVGVTPEDHTAVSGPIAAQARERHVVVVAGLNRIGERPRRNMAVVYGTDGRVLAEYEKQHFIPGLEAGYRVGSELKVFGQSGVRVGVQICKDMDFPALSRRYGRAGTDVLLVPAWDFDRDGWLHSRMAMLRGVENGFAVVRSAEQGLLTASDAYGRVLVEAASSVRPEALAVTDVPGHQVRTLYTRTGNWFAWGNVVAFAVLWIATVRKGARVQGAGVQGASVQGAR